MTQKKREGFLFSFPVEVSKSFGGGCFGGREKKAVDNVSVRVRAGGITMLLGENGLGYSFWLVVFTRFEKNQGRESRPSFRC
jgi:ABC-type Na+ transport system ATPase subunit NatA